MVCGKWGYLHEVGDLFEELCEFHFLVLKFVHEFNKLPVVVWVELEHALGNVLGLLVELIPIHFFKQIRIVNWLQPGF